jgi:hypothetical protein
MFMFMFMIAVDSIPATGGMAQVTVSPRVVCIVKAIIVVIVESIADTLIDHIS